MFQRTTFFYLVDIFTCPSIHKKTLSDHTTSQPDLSLTYNRIFPKTLSNKFLQKSLKATTNICRTFDEMLRHLLIQKLVNTDFYLITKKSAGQLSLRQKNIMNNNNWVFFKTEHIIYGVPRTSIVSQVTLNHFIGASKIYWSVTGNTPQLFRQWTN